MVEVKQILNEAKYIIEGHTVEETSKHFDISIRTVQNHMNNKLKMLSEKDENLLKIYQELQIVKQKIAKQRMIYGGTIGAKNTYLDNRRM